jgi:gamma-glutamyltranspeptidase/glutathione hydrolase
MGSRIPSSFTGAGSVAVTPHHLATAAALDVMDAGGNAVDGAVAANAVLGVVLPTTCGIGGDLFALVHRTGMDRPDVLNASGRGGSGLDPAALRSTGATEMPLFAPEAITVPGCVDGWEALLDRHGSRPLGELLRAAIDLAAGGFEVSHELGDALARIEDLVAGQASAPPLYPNGRPPSPGDTIVRTRLAETLEAIASAGRSAFYEGSIAAAVAGATGGILTTDDLAVPHADWVSPVGIDVFGRSAWTVPPNSQGYLALAAVWLLERIGPPADTEDPAFHHAVVEAYRAVAWERDELVADPDHAPLPPDRLLAPERLHHHLATFDPDASATRPAAGAIEGGTAYLCTLDEAGMGVSLIQSNFTGIGSGISAGDTGIFLHNRGAGFSLKPGHPNEAAPGRRPLHTLSPTLWTVDGRLDLLLGTRGGHQQPQYLAQTAAQLFHVGLAPDEAQALPRWEMDHAAAGTGSALRVEAGMPRRVVAGLIARGHAVEPVADFPPGWGPVSIIAAGADGTRRAAADPRVSTATAAGRG